MDVKIKHNYSNAASALNFSLQNPGVPDGDNGRVITATVYDAPKHFLALFNANRTVFVNGLHSCSYADLGLGKIIR